MVIGPRALPPLFLFPDLHRKSGAAPERRAKDG